MTDEVNKKVDAVPAIYAVILCGGSGTRLWPLSRSLRPKQLLQLNGAETLLQQTARRLLNRVAPDRLITVTHEDHKFEVKGQLAEISPALVNGVLAEPAARNTLPAIAWAVSEIHKLDPEAIVGVFPSDHAIGNLAAFLAAWEAAESAAANGYLALIGISPTEPATGYGYIEPGEPLFIGAKSDVSPHRVTRFVEKPDQANAARFVEAGYLWNGGMFIFRARVFIGMLAKYQPEIHQAFFSLNGSNVAEMYEHMPNLSMDYGLAEKADKVAVVAAEMNWSDLGSWDSIYRRHEKTPDNNVTQGEVIALDTQDSLLWNAHGLLATLGVSNLAVIQTADATLICDRARTEDIKQLVAHVQRSHPHLTKTHLTVHRPWGSYTVLEEGANFKVKRIVVNPGARISLQMHYYRSEHWVVISGVAKITNGDYEFHLQQNESTFIPMTHRHRLENDGAIPLQIIEVQSGDYVGEDDIVRLEDTYGRCEEVITASVTQEHADE